MQCLRMAKQWEGVVEVYALAVAFSMARFLLCWGRFLNRALPGTTSSYVSPCALQMVPPEADFVLLEYTFNDAERAYEGQSPDDPTR